MLCKKPLLFRLGFAGITLLLWRGMSGAPLCVSAENNRYGTVGVCVGSARSEVVDDEIVHVIDRNKEFRETRLRIEQVGIAQDIRPLLDWPPSFLEGLSLRKAIAS